MWHLHVTANLYVKLYHVFNLVSLTESNVDGLLLEFQGWHSSFGLLSIYY